MPFGVRSIEMYIVDMHIVIAPLSTWVWQLSSKIDNFINTTIVNYSAPWTICKKLIVITVYNAYMIGS